MTNIEKIRAAIEWAISNSKADGSYYPATEAALEEALALLDTPAPAQAEEVEKMAKALRMVVHNAAIQRGKEGKAWDGDFVIKQCQSALTEYLAAQDGRCPDCGYTEEDKKLHGDHHLCRRAALQSARPVVKKLVWVDGEYLSSAWALGPTRYKAQFSVAGNAWDLFLGDAYLSEHGEREEAKAAAEAHWQQKIGGCLE